MPTPPGSSAVDLYWLPLRHGLELRWLGINL
jgi:hypothetical protein